MLLRVLKSSVKFNPALQKEMEESEREKSRRSMTTRDKCDYIYMCAKDILEKKWNKLCEMKEEIRKVVGK